ncbi:MAG: T9SS type A sorting domain-containing protein [Bacteroidota bacterium]
MCYPNTIPLDPNFTITGNGVTATLKAKDDNFYITHNWKVTQYNILGRPAQLPFKFPTLNIPTLPATSRGDNTVTFPAASLPAGVNSYYIIEHTPMDEYGCSTGETMVVRYDPPGRLLLERQVGNEITVDAEFLPAVSKNEMTSGITDADNTNTRIYPNPVVDILRVESDQLVNSFRVLNSVGQEVLSISNPVGSGAYSIPTADLPKGVYFLELTLGDQTRMSKQFVK